MVKERITPAALAAPIVALLVALLVHIIGAPGAALATSAPPADAAEFPPVDDTSRIIPVNGDLAEVVYALGFGESVVATDLSATFPAEAADTPKIGYQRTLNAETILAFEPTLVLADDRAGPPEALDALRAAGVDVVVIDHHVDLQAPAYKVRALAATLGVPARGEELVADFEAQLDTALDVAGRGVAANGRPSVLAIYLRGSRVQFVFGEGSGVDAVIEAAGGSDVGTELGVDEFGELSTESIVEIAPDYLVVTTTGLASIGGLDELLAIPGLAETPAGADPEHRVLQFEDQYLLGLGPRTGQLVAELADHLHGTESPSTT